MTRLKNAKRAAVLLAGSLFAWGDDPAAPSGVTREQQSDWNPTVSCAAAK